MKFGAVSVALAAGGVVAHSIRRDSLVLKKGETVTPEHVQALQAAGIEEITVAILDAGDVAEDEAAERLATAAAGANVRVQKPFTGRSNLFATVAGVLVVDEDRIAAVNEVDEAVTVATLPPWRKVVAGEMVGTIKIIPFAAPGDVLARAIACASPQTLRVARFMPLRIGVVSTLLPGLKPSTVKKTLRVLEERLAPAGATIVHEESVLHDASALAKAIAGTMPLCDILIVFGASAITDRRDVIPAALEMAGGQIVHFGMPVDPGNLLLVGKVQAAGRIVHVLGAPGCARSPKENGFDWVLYRLLAGLDVGARDIRRMGAGGLLMEIVDRGQLREDAGAPDDD